MEPTVSLEIAKLLKEKGWEKETEFVYDCHGDLLHISSEYYYPTENNVDAPSLHEILAEIPSCIDIHTHDKQNHSLGLTLEKYGDGYEMQYSLYDWSRGYVGDPNPHNCAAKMWIYLKDNNLFPLPE